MIMEKSVINWSTDDVILHLPTSIKNSQNVIRLCKEENLDGKCLLSITDRDFHEPPFINGYNFTLGDRKKFMLWIKELQKANKTAMFDLGLCDPAASMTFVGTNWSNLGYSVQSNPNQRKNKNRDEVNYPPEDNRASTLKPEIGKTFIALLYVFLVTWVTAVVMVIVHDKVPDMKKYPPLPDLFLDNVPHIPWAFDMCEITGSFLMAIWIFVLVVHKHRFIILRRFFALAGTVFLLRCITMLITSLSVPGSHLNCAPRSYPPTDEFTNWERRFYQAYHIWSGAGMSVRGVRTCGDYMFSGHTVTLTLLNFFITEYTSRNLYLLHILTWVMNMFGIFFILAAHEHYSIDVFIAFYITSRLFLYYHTLANNQALMQGDSTRTRIWFPLLSFFESAVDGIVPNEYEGPVEVLYNLRQWSADALKNMTQSEVAKMAGTKISEGAAMGEYSVVRIVDGIKRNLSINDEPGRRLVKIDKIVQVYPVNHQSIEDDPIPECIHDNTCIENHFKKKKQ